VDGVCVCAKTCAYVNTNTCAYDVHIDEGDYSFT